MSNVPNATQSPAMSYLTDFRAEAGTAALTPETLLLYCSSRMSSIEQNIQQYFAEQQRTNKDAAELGAVLAQARFNLAQSPADLNGVGHEGDRAAVAARGNDLAALYGTLTNPDAKAACAAEFLSLTGININQAIASGKPLTEGDIQQSVTMGAIKPTTDVQVQERLGSIKDKQSALSKNGELNMIQLQALVSQRQLAVQLTTQLMQTLHESSKGVIGNIR